MKNPNLRFPSAVALAIASISLTGVSSANPKADSDAAVRLKLVEQQLASERAAHLAFDQKSAILIVENAELKQKLVSDSAKQTLQAVLNDVVDHTDEMRQQLGASQERIAKISRELQSAMNKHAELQERLGLKQRNLYASATSLQGHLERLPTMPDSAESSISQEPAPSPLAEEKPRTPFPPAARADWSKLAKSNAPIPPSSRVDGTKVAKNNTPHPPAPSANWAENRKIVVAAEKAKAEKFAKAKAAREKSVAVVTMKNSPMVVAVSNAPVPPAPPANWADNRKIVVAAEKAKAEKLAKAKAALEKHVAVVTMKNSPMKVAMSNTPLPPAPPANWAENRRIVVAAEKAKAEEIAKAKEAAREKPVAVVAIPDPYVAQAVSVKSTIESEIEAVEESMGLLADAGGTEFSNDSSLEEESLHRGIFSEPQSSTTAPASIYMEFENPLGQFPEFDRKSFPSSAREGFRSFDAPMLSLLSPVTL